MSPIAALNKFRHVLISEAFAPIGQLHIATVLVDFSTLNSWIFVIIIFVLIVFSLSTFSFDFSTYPPSHVKALLIWKFPR